MAAPLWAFGPTWTIEGGSVTLRGYIDPVSENSVAVHTHEMDSDRLIEQYRQKGYVLYERTEPTIVCQARFERLVFIPEAESEAIRAKMGGQLPATTPEPGRVVKMRDKIRALLARPHVAD